MVWHTNDETSLLKILWAKKDSNGQSHALIHHMLDTAAVCECLCHSVRGRSPTERIAEGLKIANNTAIPWIAYIVSLHDLGKANPFFQFMKPIPEFVKRSLDDAKFKEPKYCNPQQHGLITAVSLKEALSDAQTRIDDNTVKKLSAVLGGHHGVFPTPTQLPQAKRQLSLAEHQSAPNKNDWRKIRKSIVVHLLETIHPDLEMIPRIDPRDNATPILLAGLTAVADWIGSMENHFHYVSTANDPVSYYEKAKDIANRVLQEFHWSGWELPCASKPFRELFPHTIIPRPLQQKTIEIGNKIEGLRFVIIEAPMGEGKTEAALYLQDLWSIANKQAGAYFALPTMAASNQLFSRTKSFLENRYDDSILNLLLLHSHRELNQDYKSLQIASINPDEKENTSGLIAHEWFTKSKRGFLAPFAVGTVDQSLLSVMQVRHGPVRLYGLADKTLIFDEVHAYDTYMLSLFERLLSWLGQLGTTVIILSATLPNSTRHKLLTAYAGHNVSINETPYPRLTTFSSNAGINTHAIDVTEDRITEFELEWLDDDIDRLVLILESRLANGGCAVWILNSVHRAQEAFTALLNHLGDSGIELTLFHARFPLKQRLYIEKQVLERFGKERDHRPHRAILVATQVVEQSLDLDFDWMITELAPVDLLLQRSGRMHRHKKARRPSGFEKPCLSVLKPKGHELSDPLVSRSVYDEYILLRTWLAIHSRNHIHIPGDVEALIESVYGEGDIDCSSSLKVQLEETRLACESKRKREEQAGRGCVIPLPERENVLTQWNPELDEDNPEKHKQLQARTRLGPPSVSIVCLRDESEKVLPQDETKRREREQFLIESSVTLSYCGCPSDFPENMIPPEWKRHQLLRHSRMVVLKDSKPVNPNIPISLDEKLGVVLTRKGDDYERILQSDQ